jgi:hypothetical protein
MKQATGGLHKTSRARMFFATSNNICERCWQHAKCRDDETTRLIHKDDVGFLCSEVAYRNDRELVLMN